MRTTRTATERMDIGAALATLGDRMEELSTNTNELGDAVADLQASTERLSDQQATLAVAMDETAGRLSRSAGRPTFDAAADD